MKNQTKPKKEMKKRYRRTLNEREVKQALGGAIGPNTLTVDPRGVIGPNT